MTSAVTKILNENSARLAAIAAKFNPITGENSVGERFVFELKDFPIKVQHLPVSMRKVPLVKQLKKAGSIEKFLYDIAGDYDDEDRLKVIEQFVRLRNEHDFPFWAASYVYIKPKGGGEDILFRLNRPQRRLISRLENLRLANKPIRLVLLKARQWGGSTATQLYIAWLQLVHKVGLNSLIVGHVKDASTEVKDMFDQMIEKYPVRLLYQLGEPYKEDEPKLVGVGKTGNIQRIPQRKCKIKIGTAEKPNSARGGDYNCVHLTEVGLWKTTEKMTPAQIVRSALSGMVYEPYTLVVYESTANGTGNLFHSEYLAAKEGKSQFEALFVAWYEIDIYSLKFESDAERERFAKWLYENRDNEYAASDRQESGQYLYRLWMMGATLEAIHWYIAERSKYTDHGDMASEFPSNDIEAFTFSGARVFPDEDIEQFRSACRTPKWVGEIYGKDNSGPDALENLRFKREKTGRLFMWEDVEPDEDEIVTERYLVVVDVCKGMSAKADWSVITVFDRLWMMEGEGPTVVAQWRGHIDMDVLAWKSAQIAKYYNDALLVIESNTLETNNTKGEAEYILTLIRDVYDNLYARKQSAEDIKQKKPLKYGFHTNVSTKKTIIYNMKTILRDRLYTERDEGCLDEYATYIEIEGRYEAPEGYHDDRLMTRAIGMHISLHEMDVPRIVRRDQLYVRKRQAVSEASI